jgi:hypothetical protein
MPAVKAALLSTDEAFPLMYLRNAFLRVAAVSLVLALPLAMRANLGDAEAAGQVDAAVLARLGSAAPPERVEKLGSRLRVVPSPDAPPSDGVPFLEAMKDVGTPGSPKFEATGIFDVSFDCCDRLRITNARRNIAELGLKTAASIPHGVLYRHGGCLRAGVIDRPAADRAAAAADGRAERESAPGGAQSNESCRRTGRNVRRDRA